MVVLTGIVFGGEVGFVIAIEGELADLALAGFLVAFHGGDGGRLAVLRLVGAQALSQTE